MPRVRAASTTVGLILLGVLSSLRAADSEPIIAIPEPVVTETARGALGEQLFNDRRLSRSGGYACVTCHPLESGGMDGLPVAKRPGHDVGLRNTPTVFNAALNPSLNWDGAAVTLEAHTRMVVRNLMDLEWPELVARLREVDAYENGFERTYRDGLTETNAVDAIATFERTLVTPNASFDRHLRGEEDALAAEALEGYRRFKAFGCAACHQGVNVGGNLYQRFGLFPAFDPTTSRTDDIGRFAITHLDRDKRVFRVPGLRNVALTAPYFHDGRTATLEEAVEVMGRIQLGRSLTGEDTRLIAAFLRSLTGEYRGRPLTGASTTVAQR